jgi:LacI family transcriptional regulator
MRTQATRAIGCMVSDVANPLFSRVVAAAEEVIHAADYNMILVNSGDDPRREAEILSLFNRRRLDGVIMTVSRDNDPAILAMIAGFGIPTVLIERDFQGDIDSVACDHFAGATQALDYLFMLKHRRIGLITVSTAALPGRSRVRAFEAAYEREGLKLDRTLICTHGFSTDYGFAAAQEMLTQGVPPTAIIAGANQMVGVLNAARALRLDIPGDLSLISLGDTDLAQLYTPPLTTVRWRSETVGRTAAEILIARLNRPDARRQCQKVLLPTELVVRQSCRAAGID